MNIRRLGVGGPTRALKNRPLEDQCIYFSAHWGGSRRSPPPQTPPERHTQRFSLIEGVKANDFRVLVAL